MLLGLLWFFGLSSSFDTPLAPLHTAGLDTIFVQIYMDPPPGVPGVSKDAPGSTKHAIWGLVR